MAFLTGASNSHSEGAIRRGVFSRPTAICVTPDLSCLFVADAGREWTGGDWQNQQYNNKIEPPARMIKMTFASIDDLLAGSFTSATFGADNLIYPIDAAFSEGLIFVLDYNEYADRGRPKVNQVVTFDAHTLKYARCLAADILVRPKALAVHNAEVFVGDSNGGEPRVVSFNTVGEKLRVMSATILRGPASGEYPPPPDQPAKSFLRGLLIVRGHLLVLTTQLLEVMTTLGSTRQVVRFQSVYGLLSNWSEMDHACQTATKLYVVASEESGGQGGTTHTRVHPLEILR